MDLQIMKRSRRDDGKEPRVETTVANEEGYDDCSITRLPEACLAHAISLTTPMDACRSSAVSSAFQKAASSDTVWERFLPPGYTSILDRADHPVDLTSTKKELFLNLAQDHVLLDQGTKSFWLEQTSGAKCYMLSSRSLMIILADNPIYWRQSYLPDSRFEEAAELLSVCWFEMSGNIDCTELSPNTQYAAYLVFNLADESYGLDCPTQEASITIRDLMVSAKRTVSLHPRTTAQETPPCGSGGGCLGTRGGDERGGGGRAEEESTVSYPRERGDGWMEVELGEFYNHYGDTGMVAIRLTETVQLHWKKGLILEGVEIRPKS
ncbi:F-box protein PP2-B10-like [Phragmites australis]|uniref:F-box protein PP2-B10-like n=1 Tax=Phragmites australis TaxID=29695 RepID=UPI002D78685D|nr:F-box protein PP2-B10-like [Phragmites australis]